jgi:hypothetical protein
LSAPLSDWSPSSTVLFSDSKLEVSSPYTFDLVPPDPSVSDLSVTESDRGIWYPAVAALDVFHPIATDPVESLVRVSSLPANSSSSIVVPHQFWSDPSKVSSRPEKSGMEVDWRTSSDPGPHEVTSDCGKFVIANPTCVADPAEFDNSAANFLGERFLVRNPFSRLGWGESDPDTADFVVSDPVSADFVPSHPLSVDLFSKVLVVWHIFAISDGISHPLGSYLFVDLSVSAAVVLDVSVESRFSDESAYPSVELSAILSPLSVDVHVFHPDAIELEGSTLDPLAVELGDLAPRVPVLFRWCEFHESSPAALGFVPAHPFVSYLTVTESDSCFWQPPVAALDVAYPIASDPVVSSVGEAGLPSNGSDVVVSPDNCWCEPNSVFGNTTNPLVGTTLHHACPSFSTINTGDQVVADPTAAL